MQTKLRVQREVFPLAGVHMGTQKVNLQSEDGGKGGKRQSLWGAILWCVNSTKLLLLYQGTLKPVCRKLNV